MSKPPLTPDARPGWFGKIPNLGDFASRRLPDGFVRRWDHWLQHGIAQARNDLGEAWQRTYLVAPILRFWAAPGTLGSVSWAGLLMPSVDRVGRHFPLTLARPFESLAAALAARAWFDALDAAARRVLDVGFTADDLERELTAVAQVEPASVDTSTAALAAALLTRCHVPKPCSVWWRETVQDEAAFLCFTGLPPAAEFASLLGVTT